MPQVCPALALWFDSLVNLQRSQMDQCDLLSLMIKGMSVGVTVMHCFLIELPWSTQKDMACIHGKDIAKDLVLISTNGKTNCYLLLHVLLFQPERSRKWYGLKPRFPNKSVTSNVSKTATINNKEQTLSEIKHLEWKRFSHCLVRGFWVEHSMFS